MQLWRGTVLRITQGDGSVVFNFTAVNNSLPVDLTGATFSTQIRGPGGTIKTFPNNQHTANPNQVANKGKFTLTLTKEDTDALALGVGHEVLTKVTISSVVIYYHGPDLLTVQPNVPVI